MDLGVRNAAGRFLYIQAISMMSLLIRVILARNNMRTMLKGDLAFFYHSNCKTPGIAGVMEIVQEHSPDGKETSINHYSRVNISSTTV